MWHLGDLTLAWPAQIALVLDRLNGRLHLVLGNHDRAHPLFGRRAWERQIYVGWDAWRRPVHECEIRDLIRSCRAAGAPGRGR